jgi:hypothetical protein
MLETGTSGLMSGDEKRGDVSASVPALVLDSTKGTALAVPLEPTKTRASAPEVLGCFLLRFIMR